MLDLAADSFVFTGTNANKLDRNIHISFNEFHKFLGIFRKFFIRSTACCIPATNEMFINWNNIRHVIRYIINLGMRPIFVCLIAIKISSANINIAKSFTDFANCIQVVQAKSSHAIDVNSCFKPNKVEPTTSARTLCSGTIFVAIFADKVSNRIFAFSREWAFSDTRAISLHNAKYILNMLWTNTCSRKCTRCRRIGRSYERIIALVNVQIQGLCTFNDNFLFVQ